MDLSDGSDVEEGIGDVDQDAENVLLGSDDEEINFSRMHSGHHGMVEENEDKVLETDEEEDVLELALDADEELDEFAEEPLKSNRVAPVKVRNQDNAEKSQQISSSTISQSSIDVPQSTTELDDEEEGDPDSKNTRSRFLSERKTEEMNSTQTSVGNPIQILGERKGRVGHPDLRQPKSWGNQRPQGSRQFNRGPRVPQNRQSLLGDAPRHQGFRPRFPNANEAPVLQFQERIFTDFNQPLPVGQQQQINTIGPAPPMHNPPNAPRPPMQGNRNPNQPGNRQRPFKTPNNQFQENGPRPRMQNSGPRHRHPQPQQQQWKNKPPHPSGGMPPEVSGVHPAVIISGNPPFHGPGHPKNQNLGNAPNGPPPHASNHGPGANNLNHGPPHGPPGPNMGPIPKMALQGPNINGPQIGPGGNVHGPHQSPHRHNLPQGPNPNVRGPQPGPMHGPPQGPNIHGPPHNPNLQGPHMHGQPQGPNVHGPQSQGPNIQGQPQGLHAHGQLPPHLHGPRIHGPSSNVHGGGPGPIQGHNHQGPPQGPGPNPNMHRMVRPNNQHINHGPRPPHGNQNFGPMPNNFNQRHPVRPGFEGHHVPNNQGNIIMQRPHPHGDHQNHHHDMHDIGFGQPRPMHPPMNVRAPFPPQHQFANPPRLPGPPGELVENGPYFHQPPGPSNQPPMRIMEQPHPPFWNNNPQGPPPGNQDLPWNQHQDPALRNIVVVQPNNVSGDFRNSGPPGDQYQGQHPGMMNAPPNNHYSSQQYQNYDTDLPPPYMDGNHMGPGYEQQQPDPYYHGDAAVYDQYGTEYINPGSQHSVVHMNDNRYSGEESSITRTIIVAKPREGEQYLSNPRREVHSKEYYPSDRLPKKRRGDSEDYNSFGSPGKRLNHRLGPPVGSRERDEKREEAVKIILETKKEMGLDDDYIKRLEEQKRLREEILKMKEERRKLTNKAGHDSEEGYDSGHGHSSRSTGDRYEAEPPRNSVYINPKAFKGDLTLLNSNLKKINMNATSKALEASNERKAEKPERAPDVPKSRTILRIVRNKKGKIISQCKVKVVPTEHQDGPSSSKK